MDGEAWAWKESVLFARLDDDDDDEAFDVNNKNDFQRKRIE